VPKCASHQNRMRGSLAGLRPIIKATRMDRIIELYESR
jgi:hypothetical protein